MFTNPANNIQDSRLDNLRRLFPTGEVNKERTAVATAALQAMQDFKNSPESKGCPLFNESKDAACQANFAGMEVSIKLAMKLTNIKKVNGMLDDTTARILPTLDEDLKSFKAADPDSKRKTTYDAAIAYVSEIKTACNVEGQMNSPSP